MSISAFKKINLRSPYYIKSTPTTNLVDAEMALYIYDGANIPPTSSLGTYTIKKTPIGSNDYVVFEISELVRDFIDNSFDGTYVTNSIWVWWNIDSYDGSTTTTESSYSLAIDGYNYFEDGIQTGSTYQQKKGSLISNNLIYRLNDSNVRVPVNAADTNSVIFLLNGEVKATRTFGSIPTQNDEQVDYVTVGGGDDYDTYKQRVLSSGGIYELTPCLEEFLCTLDIGDVDEIRIITDDSMEIIKVESFEEIKYSPYKITFINKFGVLQDMWFFKKSIDSITTKEDSYKANILDFSTPTYSTSAHQIQSFNKNGNEAITLNSGFYDEEYNEVVKQMLLSEEVWIDNGSEVLPVNVNNNSYTFQTSVNDKLIQHTLEFSYAYDKINNIR